MKKLIPYLFMALVFGLVMFLVLLIFSSLFGLKTIALVSLAAGILFSVLMFLFASSRHIKEQASLPAEEAGTGIIYSDPANHTINSEAVGGRLYLTYENLIFKSHKVALNPHQLKIPVADIVHAETFRVIGVLPTGLRIIMRDGRKEKFTVNDQDKWVAEINKVLKL